MKIVLMDIQGLVATGIRSLSSRLKANKHSVKLIFERGETIRMIYNKNYLYRYKQSVLNEIVELCKDVDMVGLSVMTNFFDRAVQITYEIKKRLSVPVVWGGIHPSARPEECLEFTDIVCVGEAEESLLKLIDKMEQGKDYYDTNGFVFKKGKQIINKSLELDLVTASEIPEQDYDYKHQYIIHKGHLVELNQENIPEFLGYNLPYATSRGCAMRCSYCYNDFLKSLYRNGIFLRLRNLDNVLEEIKQIVRIYPSINSIFFTDDNFLSHSYDELKKFAFTYKKEINLPFLCNSTPFCDDQKIAILLEAGLKSVRFGLQTVNKHILRRYNRPADTKKLFLSMPILRKVNQVRFDVILESPFETDYERLNTIRFLLSLPINFTLSFFSLTFYPETSLAKYAIEQGIIEKDNSHRKCESGPQVNMVNLLFFLTKLSGEGKIPRWIIKILSLKLIFFILNRKFLNFLLYNIGRYRYKRTYSYLDEENYI